MNESRRQVPPALAGLALAAALLVFPVSPEAQSNAFVTNLLRQEGLSTGDLRAVGAGEAIVKTLDTSIRAELAYFGVVHIDAPVERFVTRFRDIERFESGPGIPQIGRFATQPRLENLASLKLPAADIAALSTCRPGDCDIKLSAADMARFREQVSWSSPNAAPRANELARRMFLELVDAYRANGNAALGHYEDGGEALSVADQFHALLTSGYEPPLPVPELVDYLIQYPRSRPAGAEDFFYWSVVDFGLKETVRLNHVVIYPLAGSPSGVSHVVAIKQLYASHYFQTALELRFLIDDQRTGDRPGFYLVSLTRSRIDGTTGFKGALLRPIISRRSRTAVRNYLAHLKRQVERPEPATF